MQVSSHILPTDTGRKTGQVKRRVAIAGGEEQLRVEGKKPMLAEDRSK